MHRRHTLLLAVPACVAVLWLSCAPASASRSILDPAPPATATGVAAQVGSLVAVSPTTATADTDSGSADAAVVRLFEDPVLGLGGTQQGDGQTGGALLDTQDALPAQVQVAPWSASASGTGTSTRQSRGTAAVARAAVPDVADAGVLTSDSQATHTDAASNGRAVTEGANIGLLDAVRLVLLHSEVSSDGMGSSYLLGLNGIELGTDEQLGGTPLCALDAAGLASLSCLSATGGPAGSVTEAASQVLGITPALDVLSIIDPVAAFASSASAGQGTTTVLPDEATPVASETSRATEPAASAATGGANTLPRTGFAFASLLLTAAVFLLFGPALRHFRLRPTAA